jgi:predicted RNA-binding Zn-ribbon protein involved in translation (DUF1610 family)
MIGGFIFLLSLWDIIIDLGFQWFYIVVYLCLLIGSIVLFIVLDRAMNVNNVLVEVFEKTLMGELKHFKCPLCHGIFAVKKSCRMSDHEYFLTCPDCGHLGRISRHHLIIFDDVPGEKSSNVHFECVFCGEHVKIWAEGHALYPYVTVFSCPFCQEKSPLVRI